jgi:hypothetical protein
VPLAAPRGQGSHNAGAGGVRDLRYDDDCGCFEYAGSEVFKPRA